MNKKNDHLIGDLVEYTLENMSVKEMVAYTECLLWQKWLDMSTKSIEETYVKLFGDLPKKH